MIFNSRKLRKIFVSGLMAASLGLGNVSAGEDVRNSIPGAIGNLFHAGINTALTAGKVVSVAATSAKVGSTLASQTGVLDDQSVRTARNYMSDKLEYIGLKDKNVKFIKDLTLYAPDDSMFENGKYITYDLLVWLGLRCFGNFVDGFCKTGKSENTTVIVQQPQPNYYY